MLSFNPKWQYSFECKEMRSIGHLGKKGIEIVTFLRILFTKKKIKRQTELILGIQTLCS
jgi:hypothetical protein